MVWFVLGHSGQRTSVKCAEATWNYKAGGIMHWKSPAVFFCVCVCVFHSGYIFSYGLFYNQGTSSKITWQPCFNRRSLLWFQSAFAKTLIRVRSTYSNKENVRINQLFKKICSFVMILLKIAVPFGFSQILYSSITWNKHKESLLVNSEEIIWTRSFKI